jgi:acetyltransferase-like isoleucine patch superfamily enzyme
MKNINKYLPHTIKKSMKKIFLFFYNRQNDVTILSEQVNLNANLGKKVFIGKNVSISAEVEIGKFSYVNQNSNLRNCKIGNYCSISYGVNISPSEHYTNYITTHPILYEKHFGFVNNTNKKKLKKVEIGNDVLISINSTILEGVKIGDGAIVAAGAVVTKDVRPYEIVGGVPAKHIRYRFDQNKIDFLTNLEWWNWDEEKIKDNIVFLKTGKIETLKQ